MAEFFNCLLLTRDDLKEVGFDAETLTDAQMERLAQKIGESCMEEFWASLEFFAKNAMSLIKVSRFHRLKQRSVKH